MTINSEQIQALKAAANKLHRSDLFVSFPDEERQVADVKYCSSTLARVFPDRWPTTPPDVKAKQVENWANYFVLVNPKFILSMLEERDADKALIAELKNDVDAANARVDAGCAQLCNQDEEIEMLRQRIAELEARTLTVKLPRDITHVTNKYFEEGRDAVLEAIESQLAAAGITLDVGE